MGNGCAENHQAALGDNTSAPSSAIPGGCAPPAWLYTQALPSSEAMHAMPLPSCAACTTVSRASRARSRVVRTYGSSRKVRSRFALAQKRHAGTVPSPCSHPGVISLPCPPEFAHQRGIAEGSISNLPDIDRSKEETPPTPWIRLVDGARRYNFLSKKNLSLQVGEAWVVQTGAGRREGE